MNEVTISFWMMSFIFALLSLAAGIIDRDQAAEWLVTLSMGGFLAGLVTVFISAVS